MSSSTTDNSAQNITLTVEDLPVPVTKLDADQYSAEDLTGNTDTAAGTGNLNYALLQSSITRDAQAIAPEGALLSDPVDTDGISASTPFMRDVTNPIASDAIGNAEGPTAFRAGSDADNQYNVSNAAIGRFQSSTIGMPGTPGQNGASTSSVSSSSNGTNGPAGSNGSNGRDGETGNVTTTVLGTDGKDGENGRNGENGHDDHDHGGDTYNTSTVNNTYNTYEGGTVNNYHSETVQTTYNTYNQTNNSNTVVNNNTTVNNTTNNNTTNNNDDHSVTIINVNHDHDHDHHHHHHGDPHDPCDHDTPPSGPQDHDLSLDLLGHDTGLLFNPLENLTGDIDVIGGINLDLLNTGNISNANGDSDITLGSQLEAISGPLAGVVADINLDAIEAITGDIDIDLGAAINGLGQVAPGLADALPGGTGSGLLLEPVADLVSDLTGLGSHGDSDVNLSVGGNAVVIPVTAAADLVLDPVEDVVGDIDIAASPDLNILTGQGNDPATVNIIGDLGIANTGVLQGVNTVSLAGFGLDPLVGGTTNLAAAIDLLGSVANPSVVNALPGGTGANTVLSQVGHGLADLGTAVFGSTPSNGDSDLVLNTGVDLIDHGVVAGSNVVNLNPVEDLVGDIDTGVSPDLTILSGQSNNPATVTIVGDVDGANTDVLQANHTLSLDGLGLDPIIGGNTNITAAADLLGSVADPLVNGATGGTGADNIITHVGQDLSDLGGALFGDNAANGDTDVTLTTGIDLVDHSILSGTDALNLNPVEDVIGDVDLAISGGIDPFGASNDAAGESDLSLFGDVGAADQTLALPEVHLNLDPVESLVGDVDLSVDLSTNLLHNTADPVVDNHAGGTGGDNLLTAIGQDLTGLNDAVFGSDNGDTDLSVHTGIDLVDHNIASIADSINLNPVEDLVGDIDIAINLGANPFGSHDTGGNDVSLFSDVGGDGNMGTQPEVGLNLDPVEQFTGNLNVSVDSSIALLQPVADPVVDHQAGGGGSDTLISSLLSEVNSVTTDVLSIVQNPAATTSVLGNTVSTAGDFVQSWTEMSLPHTTDHVADTVSSALGSILPDPVSSVSHGLGGLVDSHHDTGNTHHHGLFG